jgi:tRNA (guanine6-N2)-methyltransferase
VQRIFGLTTRGLETVSAQEMAALPGLVVTETTYRRIAAQYADLSLAELLRLRTLDDLYLELAIWNGIGHTRDTLKIVSQLSQSLDLQASADVCAKVRPIAPRPLFSVTASFVGKRNYNADEIKLAVAEGIKHHYDWTYTPDDRSADFNVRMFIQHQTAYVGLRLGKRALHERNSERIERPGALKPSVAAAMLKFAHVEPGMTLLDPCCGTGTILIEAAQMGAVARGGDVEVEAVSAAETNIQAAGVQARVEQWDARRLPLPDYSVDRVVSNLPWGRQIAVDDTLVSFYRAVCREMERMVTPKGQVALLTSLPELLRFTKLQPEQKLGISLFGQRPTIALYTRKGL